jgi:hypothetical protein
LYVHFGVQFELDGANIRHFLVDHPERGLTVEILVAIAAGAPRIVSETPEDWLSSSHKLVGPDGEGRFWTVAALELENDWWRPITGWPSTNKEKRLYEETN